MVEQPALFSPIPQTLKRVVYTLGYSGGRPGLKPGEINRFVVRRNAIVVDTRLSTRSRVLHWTQARLEQVLADRYVHIPDFGNQNYKHPDAGIVLRNPQRGYIQLVPVLAQWDIVLLCACEDASKCHRTQVAAYIAEQADVAVTPLTIQHLRLDNKSPQGEKGNTHGTL